VTDTRIPSLIRMLGSPNDNEVVQAARALSRELDLEDLARVWDRAQADRPEVRPERPIDYSKVETAVTLYSQGKTQVSMNKLLRAVRETVAEMRVAAPSDWDEANKYITARLRALGFKPSVSGNTYSRGDAA
jgi:hypothetical protein